MARSTKDVFPIRVVVAQREVAGFSKTFAAAWPSKASEYPAAFGRCGCFPVCRIAADSDSISTTVGLVPQSAAQPAAHKFGWKRPAPCGKPEAALHLFGFFVDHQFALAHEVPRGDSAGWGTPVV